MRAAQSSASCLDGQSAPWTEIKLDLCPPTVQSHKPWENTGKVQRLLEALLYRMPLNRVGVGGQEILAEGVLAKQQWLVVMQEKMHSHQLIPTVVGNWSAFSSSQWSNLYHCSPFSVKSSALVRFFLGQGPLLSQFAEQSSIQPFI